MFALIYLYSSCRARSCVLWGGDYLFGAHNPVVCHALCGCVDSECSHAGTSYGARAATSGVCGGSARHGSPKERWPPHRRSTVACSCQPAERGV